MPGPITRNRVVAYIIDFVGILLVVLYGAGRSPKIALSYQAPELFLYVGIALIISGTALVFYDMKKNVSSHAKQNDELG